MPGKLLEIPLRAYPWPSYINNHDYRIINISKIGDCSMPKYNYQCLYCGNCDLSLGGLNDHMTLCSRCGNLTVRLEDDFFWEFFGKNHLQFIKKENLPLPPTTGGDSFVK